MGSIKKPDGSKFEKEEDLDDSTLREFFEKKASANKNNVTVPMLNKMDNKQLWMDMRDECAYSRMDNLFLTYFMILKKNGCEWVIENAPKVAAKHILSKIRPDPVRNRIANDLKLAHADLKKDFRRLPRTLPQAFGGSRNFWRTRKTANQTSKT